MNLQNTLSNSLIRWSLSSASSSHLNTETAISNNLLMIYEHLFNTTEIKGNKAALALILTISLAALSNNGIL